MKIGSCRKIYILAALFFWLGHLTLTRGADVTLTLSVAPEPVVAGGNVSVWLNVLNASSNAIAWTFPAQIKRKIISAQGAFDGALEFHSAETNAVAIAPGAFVRREYVSAVPDSITGQIVMEFSGLNLARAVLDVQAPPVVATGPGKNTNSLFTRFIEEVEPEQRGQGLEPGQFFKEHISGYEPMYFIAGPTAPNAKFQISFAYQLLNRDGALATNLPALKGFHIAYTQTSLWDVGGASAPFYDTSYKPEFFYAWQNVTRGPSTNWFQLDLQGSLKHESNGKSDADSRSLNIAYLRPTLTLGRDDGLQLVLQPRVWTYLGDLSDNPDIADYRGYVDLRMIAGWKRGLQVSALGRMGKDGDHPGILLDVTYPTMKFFGSFSLYLDVQYFNGYGESLLGYNKKSDELRIGFALFR